MIILRVTSGPAITDSPMCRYTGTALTNSIQRHHPSGSGWNYLPTPRSLVGKSANWLCGCASSHDFRKWWPEDLMQAIQRTGEVMTDIGEASVFVLDVPNAYVCKDEFQVVFDSAMARVVECLPVSEFNKRAADVLRMLDANEPHSAGVEGE